MLRSLRGASAAFSCVALLAGCGQGPVAVVEGRKISEKEFYEELERRAGGETVMKVILADMVTREAAAQGVVVPEERLTQDMRLAVQQAGSAAAWAKELERRGHTEESWRRERRLELLVGELLTKDVTVSDAEVKEFYDRNRKRYYDQPGLYAIAEIVLDDKAEAQRLREELKKPGADFASLARRHSVSAATAVEGGRRGPTPLEFIRPAALQPVVANLVTGETSPVIQADDLWYIVRLEDKSPAVESSIKDPAVAEDARERLRLEKGKTWPELLQELKARYEVTIVWPQYKFLEEQFASPAGLPQFGVGEQPSEAGEKPGPAPTEKEGGPAGAQGGEKKPAGAAKPEPKEKAEQKPQPLGAGGPEKKPVATPAVKAKRRPPREPTKKQSAAPAAGTLPQSDE